MRERQLSSDDTIDRRPTLLGNRHLLINQMASRILCNIALVTFFPWQEDRRRFFTISR
jgi:hypothetical protein